MNLVPRVQGILLKPKEEWVKIKDEPATVSGLITSYAALLAAVPAIAQFIGFSLIGIKLPYANVFRLGLGTSLVRAVVSYVFALATVYVAALVIKILAPNFSSNPDMVAATKLAVYSMTPAWIAGVFYLIPALGILVILASLYGIYILYLGFDAGLMNTPKEKVLSYFLVSVIVFIVLLVIFGILLGAIFMAGVGTVRTVPVL